MKNLNYLTVRFCFAAVLGIFLFSVAAPNAAAKPKDGDVCVVKVKLGGKVLNGFSEATPQCKSAKAAFASASVIVTGITAEFISITWFNEMLKNPAYAAKYQEGLGFVDAVKWLKSWIADNSSARTFAIDNAFQEVYGRKSTAAEQAAWDSQVRLQKAWYAPIVLAESSKVADDKAARTEMIARVYDRLMGRMYTPTELEFWMSHKEHYRLIMEKGRTYLYSANGVTDLIETIGRALTLKTKKAPTDDDVKKAMTEYAGNKRIYAEMIAKDSAVLAEASN